MFPSFGIRTCCALLAALLTVASGAAQSGRNPFGEEQKSDEQQKGDDAIRLRADEVLLNIAVFDGYNHQATDLSKSEFIIAEDGQRQDILSFALSTVPVNVVMMLDASGSVVSEIGSLRDAAMGFVEQLAPDDKVSITEFHTNIELLQDWTSKPDDMRHALSWRFKPGMVRTSGSHSTYGSTALYDAIVSAADQQLAKVQGRKAIIILTDGDDTSSKLTYDQALQAVIRSGATVYVISKARAFIEEANRYRGKVGHVLGASSMADMYVARMERAEQLMTEISARSGGRIYSPLKDEEMRDVWAQVAKELKNQYIITYVSKNEARDGRLRHVNVYLSRSGYSARTRDSYYAPKK